MSSVSKVFKTSNFLSRYTQVTPTIWRGPRPEGEDFDEINKRFKYVLSLEGIKEDEKEKIQFKPSIKLISYPISFSEIYFTGLNQSSFDILLGTLSLYSIDPTLVHCQHGEDRTGLVIAAYRVRYQGWTKETAMEEALKLGYRGWLNFGLNKTWKEFKV
jgi:tyrosine-protein phosphatase SIW14